MTDDIRLIQPVIQSILRPSVFSFPVMRHLFSLIFLILGFLAFNVTTVSSQPGSSPCQKQLAPIKKSKNTIIQNGGVWAVFERHPSLRPQSSRAIQLDSKVQQLVWLLDYLCETREGVPLNELALYLTENLAKKSKKEFRAELIVLGKSSSEIDIWFSFVDIALKNEHRKLESRLLKESIQRAQPFISRYQTLARDIDASPNDGQLDEVDQLYRQIQELESSDVYLIQAVTETSQVPYWDINESTGGS